jgi:exodeoxyribonuclease-3
MRVATWNVNGLRARLDFVRLWLRDRQPDLAGLQELKLTDEQFPAAEIQEEGYQYLAHGQKAWNGVAVLARNPIELVHTGLPGGEDFGARLITARCEELTFTTVYCPNGKSVEHDDFPRKLGWFEALAAHLEQSHDPGQPTILCGDFNICPTALDSWNEEGMKGGIFHTDEERERFQRLLAWGLTDLFRQSHPDERQYSWWDYRAGGFPRNQGLRIDFLLGTSSVAERLRSVTIDREYRKKKNGLTASDHAPVIADLD